MHQAREWEWLTEAAINLHPSQQMLKRGADKHIYAEVWVQECYQDQHTLGGRILVSSSRSAVPCHTTTRVRCSDCHGPASKRAVRNVLERLQAWRAPQIR